MAKNSDLKIRDVSEEYDRMKIISQNELIITLLQESNKILKDISKNTFPGH